MNNDRELLMLSAKAAGYSLSSEWNSAAEGIFIGKGQDGEPLSVWNPLANDGDALRLAVKLEINIVPSMEEASARNPSHTGWVNEDAARDPYAATRRAIVRAAAEIGRAMP